MFVLLVVQVVNLVSNDVRRFDDVGPYYMYLWAGPVEVVCVLVMVGAQLTFPASAAGVATLLLLIPFQVRSSPFPIGFPMGFTCLSKLSFIHTVFMFGLIMVAIHAWLVHQCVLDNI